MRKILIASLGLLGAAAMTQGAAAADLPVKAPVVPLVVPFSWTGFYVGANVGYSVGRASTDLAETSITSTTATISGANGVIATATAVGPPVAFAGSDRARMNGWIGGLQGGYNWQTDRWVWGIEGDIQATGERGGTTFCFPLGTACGAGTTAIGTANYSLRWLGTLRGRTGVTFDRVLLYATGGLAVGQLRGDFSDGIAAGTLTPATIASGSGNFTRLGWVLGAGIEGAIDNNWSVKLEYLHVDLGSVSAAVNGTATGAASFTIGDFITNISQITTFNSAFRARVTDDIVRIGVNYRFAPAAVVVRY